MTDLKIEKGIKKVEPMSEEVKNLSISDLNMAVQILMREHQTLSQMKVISPNVEMQKNIIAGKIKNMGEVMAKKVDEIAELF